MSKQDATSTTLRIFEPPTAQDIDVYAAARACLQNLLDENKRLRELVKLHAPWELEESK